MRAIALVLFTCLAIVGCGGRQGIVLQADGSIRENSPENARAHAETVIANALGRQFTPRSASVAIAQLPRWQTEDRARAEGWYWDMVRVDVTMAGSVSADERQQIEDVVRDRLAGAITGGRDALLVRISDGPAAPVAVEAAPAAPAPAATAPVATAPAATTAASGVRRYTIQAGDTLGDISAVFFGSAQHWRRIVEANPGLDPARLNVGQTIVIPATSAP